jgi:osmotically-inducible protein OsmY
MSGTSTLTAVIAATLIAITTPAMSAPAATPRANDLTPAFIQAGLSLDRLQVFEIGGIVVIRGRAVTKADAEQAALIAQQLGYARVANLVQVIEAPDDRAIERRAEMELTSHRSLDGCKFRIDSEKGVLTVGGSVQHELQKDVTIQLLRTIDGVREVRTDLTRF